MKILYFAWVKDRVGISEETIDLPSDINSISGLIEWMAARGGNYADVFASTKSIRIAVNHSYAPVDQSISNDDEIAFFPPVTGG
jgi:molybdopterin synthase sulfur carrier subunit